MMSRFHSGLFGLPDRVKGISTPMNAGINSLGRITMFGPTTPGNPAEKYADKKPPNPPVYSNPVVVRPYMPPMVLPINPFV